MVLEFRREITEEEITVEETKAANHFIGGEGSVNVEGTESHTGQQLRAVEAPVCLWTLVLEEIVCKRPEGQMGAPKDQVVHILPAIKGVPLTPSIVLVGLGPQPILTLKVKGDHQHAMTQSPEDGMHNMEAPAQSHEIQNKNVGVDDECKQIRGTEELEIENIDSILVFIPEEALRFIIQKSRTLLFIICRLTNCLVSFLDMRILDEYQEDHLTNVSKDRNPQHCIAVADHRVTVVETVSHSVHRMREHLEDAIEYKLLTIKQEEEITPIPSVLSENTVGVSLGPHTKDREGEANCVKEDVHQT
mmetsp:Transcript_58896/g.105012  ORF Transcript_58896/g.105012 Transcript_58896/m.105012 type:complete len:304 (+) Transcript_58896:1052-1963(+)